MDRELTKKLKERYIETQRKLRPTLSRPKNQAYFVLVLSFFTMAFFGFFAIRPTLRTISELNRKIADSRELNQKLTQKINDLASVQADYELIRGAIPAIYRTLPETADFPNLAYDIEDVAQNAHATISALTFDSMEIASAAAKPAEAHEPVPIIFQVTFNGSYDQIMTAMNVLLNSKRLIKYDDVGFAVTEKAGNQLNLTINLAAKSYYY